MSDDMAMDREAVQDWLNHYVEVWGSGDATRVRELFTEDVEYHPDPYREPRRGLDQVADWWEKTGDAPGAFEAEFEPVEVAGDFAAAVGRARYLADAQAHNGKEFANIFLLWFAPDGRCRRYQEWYFEKPG